MNEDDEDKALDYVTKLADVNGIAVVTVKDGWVFLISQNQLQALLESAKEKGSDGKAMLFVKNSALQSSTNLN